MKRARESGRMSVSSTPSSRQNSPTAGVASSECAAVSAIPYVHRARRGWTLALALSVALAARFLPSILYVRAALARLHGKKVVPLPPLAAHVAALACVVALVCFNLLPLLAMLPFAVMLLRAALVLCVPRWRGLTARRIGFGEIACGALTVLLIVAGQRFDS
ncbi:MAG: hypothetical protein ACJ741_21705 [Pyrinomonadaceae bacterium]